MKYFLLVLLTFFLSAKAIKSQDQVKEGLSSKSRFSFISEFGIGITYLKGTPNLYSNRTNNYPLRGFLVIKGLSYQVNEKWSIGILANANIAEVTRRYLSPLGIRLRIAHYINSDWEYNISGGARASLSSDAGYDIRTSLSWKNHLGIFLKYEDLPRIINPTPHAYSIGIYTKGKKGIIFSAIAQAIGLYALFDVIRNSR